jgi:Tol biopolymer transport system component
MPDLKEIFEMVKQQTNPDPDSWQEQERRLRREARNRKTGSFALVAALVAGVTVVAVSWLGNGGGGGTEPAADPTDSAQSLYTSGGFVMLDINTGERTGTGIVPASSSIDVSPDVAKIVYIDDVDGADLVHVANLDGSDAQAFETTEGAEGAGWSPDGTKIVYQRPGAFARIGNLFILDVATGRTTRITDLERMSSGVWWMAPTFSPDGETVLFTMPLKRGSTQRWHLWSVPVTGGEPTLVRRNAFAGDYSPDGASIAYSKALDVDGDFELRDLYIARADGSDARKVIEGSVAWARWSPDGTKLLFDDGGLSILNIETGESRKILDGIGDMNDWVDDDTVILEIGE